MPMPASPDAAPPRPAGRVDPVDLALTEPGEWSPASPAARPRDAPPDDPPHPGLAIFAALMAVALMVLALDLSQRTGATDGAACVRMPHGERAVPAAPGGSAPRRGRLVRTP